MLNTSVWQILPDKSMPRQNFIGAKGRHKHRQGIDMLKIFFYGQKLFLVLEVY